MRSRPEAIAFTILFFMLNAAVAQDDAKAIIERAIKARAPKEEALKKQAIMVMKLEGKVYPELPALREHLAEWPNNFRFNIEYEANEGKKALSMAIHGDQGWYRMLGGAPADLTFSTSDSFREEIYGRWLATLYPLRDPGYKLTLLKDSKVGDEETTVVKASRDRKQDVNLHFSKKTGHLLKIAYSTRENDKACRKEHVFAEFKEFDGLVLPTKLVDYVQEGIQPNKKMGDWIITSYQFPEKLPAGTFEKPGKKE